MLVNAPADGRERPLTPPEIARCERNLMARLEACGLGLEAASEPVITTPSAFEAMFPGTGGALYGRASQGWAATFQAAGLAQPGARAVSRGGLGPSGAGRADGGAVGAARGGGDPRRPRFDGPVAQGGYAWWYVDAVSDDGRCGLTIIAFIGSVFSPYYAWSADRDPFAHCAMNVVLYGDHSRFAMTERGTESLSRGADHIAIGPSAMEWDGTALTVRFGRARCPPAPPDPRQRAAPTERDHRRAVPARSGWAAPLVADGAGCACRSHAGRAVPALERKRLFRHQRRRRAPGGRLLPLDVVPGGPAKRRGDPLRRAPP